jgi:hypothetical protein
MVRKKMSIARVYRLMNGYRIGEKFLAWTDQDPPLDEILASVTLYWLTETFPRSIYPYRQVRISFLYPSISPFSSTIFHFLYTPLRILLIFPHRSFSHPVLLAHMSTQTGISASPSASLGFPRNSHRYRVPGPKRRVILCFIESTRVVGILRLWKGPRCC